MDSHKNILFVEDDDDDRELIYEAIKEITSDVEALFATNGLEAIDYLVKVQQNERRLPCLIVLDLNMPFLDGRQTFERIKNDLHLTTVPIIIFTSSQSPEERALFESKGAEFITKPMNFSYLKKVISHMLTLCCSNYN